MEFCFQQYNLLSQAIVFLGGGSGVGVHRKCWIIVILEFFLFKTYKLMLAFLDERWLDSSCSDITILTDGNLEVHTQGGYSGILVTGTCEDLFWVWNSRLGTFLGFEIFCWTFFALKILARTFFGVDENCALPFLILRKTISLTSLNHANKMTRQRQLSLSYSGLFVNDPSSCIRLFLGYVFGCWTFFGFSLAWRDFFWVSKFGLIRTSPSLIHPSTPPGSTYPNCARDKI